MYFYLTKDGIITMTPSISHDSLKKLYLLLALYLLSSLFAINLIAQQRSEAYSIEQYPVDQSLFVQAITSGGHIEMIGDDVDAVELQLFVRKKGKYLSSSEYTLSEDFEFDSKYENGRLMISTKRKKQGILSWGNSTPSVSYKLIVPKRLEAKLRTSGGHLDLADLEGDMDISTSGGHITVQNLSGTLKARTSGGHIELLDLEGEIDANTSGGHIKLTNAQGMFKLRTSGGNIDVENVDGELSASTSGGHVKAVMNSVNGDLSLRTSGGNVSLQMPGTTPADLELRGSNVVANLQNFNGQQSKSKIEGQINGGGYKIEMKTSGGTARLSLN
jgi:hypothetical protein